MNEDLELIENEIKERQTDLHKQEVAKVDKSQEVISNVTKATEFTKAIDKAKINAVQDAAANDDKFVKDFTEELKQATLKSAQVEQEKQQLEKQNIQYAQELLETKQKLNETEQQVNEWETKQKRRQYHYDGVKPIMEFVGIKTPMNLFLLYALTSILVWFFLLHKLIKGTIGAIIAGAESEDRPKAVKGFLWTMLGVIVVGIIAILTLLTLRWFGVI